MKDFIDAHNISFPIALDPSGHAANAFGIQYTNTHVLIDRDGNLVRTIPGDIQEVDIVALIEQTSAPEGQSNAADDAPCRVAFAQDSKDGGICTSSEVP